MNANGQSFPTRDIDLSFLRAFVSVAESGSMTAAARRLHVTQGAISQRIKRLEDLFQKKLFERVGNGLETTIDGDKLLRPAQKLISQNDQLFSAMTAPEFSGVVRLGVPYDIIFPFLSPILKSFALAHPKVKVELELSSSENLKRALDSGELQLTMTTEVTTPKGSELLTKNALVWVGGIDTDSHKKSPVNVITIHKNCMFRTPMLQALDRAGVGWTHVVTQNMDATIAMMAAGLGVTALLESTVPSSVRILKEEDGMPDLEEFCINLYTSSSSSNDASSELANHIREHFQQWRRPHALMAVS